MSGGHIIQVRNVPADFHRRLKARAAIEGMSMSGFILRELRKALERRPRQEILERLAGLQEGRLTRSAAELIREERDSR